MVDFNRFQQLVSGTESYIPDCVEIIFDMIAVPISAVHGLAEKPTELIKWDEAAHCFIRLSSEVTLCLLQYIIMLTLYCRMHTIT